MYCSGDRAATVITAMESGKTDVRFVTKGGGKLFLLESVAPALCGYVGHRR